MMAFNFEFILRFFVVLAMNKCVISNRHCDHMNNTPCSPGHYGATCNLNIKRVFPFHNVYEGFEPQAEDLQGWPNSDAAFYAHFVNLLRPKLVIEVGVWKGASAILLATAMKTISKGGTFIAVDTWLGALEFYTEQRKHKDMERDLRFKNGWPTIYYQFLSNVVQKGLQDFVIPMPMPSRMAHNLLQMDNVEADLIHIDAAHEYPDVSEDIALWWSILKRGGILLGDDYTSSWPGVIKAADEWAQRMNLTLRTTGAKWWIVKCL
eukprot:gb/GEZN01015841.1/.p1 GENE.gb/GEZN01015841.1/~~gb/GEZN01015841.1/.p1  ORF type:complete len:264 (+),score=6.44 gb/GEZN01015841.1/:24-815(+)